MGQCRPGRPHLTMAIKQKGPPNGLRPRPVPRLARRPPRARARYLAPITLTPQITTLDEATPDDIAAMVSDLRGNVDLFPSHGHHLDALYVQDKDGLKIAFYGDLTGRTPLASSRNSSW